VEALNLDGARFAWFISRGPQREADGSRESARTGVCALSAVSREPKSLLKKLYVSLGNSIKAERESVFIEEGADLKHAANQVIVERVARCLTIR
jgi:hypothetical protein